MNVQDLRDLLRADASSDWARGALELLERLDKVETEATALRTLAHRVIEVARIRVQQRSRRSWTISFDACLAPHERRTVVARPACHFYPSRLVPKCNEEDVAVEKVKIAGVVVGSHYRCDALPCVSGDQTIEITVVNQRCHAVAWKAEFVGSAAV